jgi:hypothetical protein
MAQDRAEFRRMQIATMATNAADRSNMQSGDYSDGKRVQVEGHTMCLLARYLDSFAMACWSSFFCFVWFPMLLNAVAIESEYRPRRTRTSLG